MSRQSIVAGRGRASGWLHRHSALLRHHYLGLSLAAGLGLCLLAGLPLLAAVLVHPDFLADHSWFIVLTSVVGVSLVIGIGGGLLGLVRVLGIEIERLEQER